MNHTETIRQAMIAEEHISRLVIRSIGSNVQNEKVIIDGFHFTWNTENLENKQVGCLSWIDRRNNEESMCLYVPLYKE
ncbi:MULTISPECIES: hypothetical protein [Allobacillus]|uniref:Uncharacterized protein n=1 Tax=Allobacillus salarius TaxID=1955272 RepID=A0A556PTH0_9BACI|nr:hypothetical protein [Allobacillus salarius]TSJ67690.1 hypothetical protein FPQ13_01060 [Allobacillus salarius]